MIASLRVQHPLNGEGESGHVAGSLFPISGDASPVTLQTLLARFPSVTPKILLALAVLAMCDNSVTPQRQCACGCGESVTGKEKTAGPACRKRMQRERDRARLAALPANRQFNLVLQNELPLPIPQVKPKTRAEAEQMILERWDQRARGELMIKEAVNKNGEFALLKETIPAPHEYAGCHVWTIMHKRPDSQHFEPMQIHSQTGRKCPERAEADCMEVWHAVTCDTSNSQPAEPCLIDYAGE